MDHQPADEVNVARQPIELRDDDRVMRPPRGREGGGEDGPPLQGVDALARLHLDDQLVTVRPPRAALQAIGRSSLSCRTNSPIAILSSARL
jgi:hypothetical protein